MAKQMWSRFFKILGIAALLTVIVILVLAYLGPKLSDHRPDGACLTVGCPSRITILFTGDIPLEYQFEMTSGRSQVSFSCGNGRMVPGSYERINAGTGVYLMGYDRDITGCIDDGVIVNQFVPRRFSITLTWDGGEKMTRYRPKYEWCDSLCCMCGTFLFELP